MIAEKMVESNTDWRAASTIIRTVPIPFAFLFFTDVGEYTGEFAPCLADFCEKLRKTPLESVEFHFERGDFERWIRDVLGDEYLAKRINEIDRSIQGEELRATIQSIVERRLSQLKKKISDEPPIEIQNVVSTAELKEGIDLEAVCKAFPMTEYRREVFPGLVFRLRRPKTSTLIFSSGKMVCTGGKSEKEAVRAIKKIVRMLKKKKLVIRGRPEVEIQNIVASGDLGGEVDIIKFYRECGLEKGGGVMYEPEQFPGLIYRMEDPNAVILVFSSGKLVCTGTKRETDVYRSVEKIRRKIEDYGVMIHS